MDEVKAAPHAAPDLGGRSDGKQLRRQQDLEDQADSFEEDLAAEMMRTGAIERW